MAEGKKIKKILRVEREDYSGLSAFVERPVPTEREVAGFEQAVGREARNQEIEEHLSEIYSGRDGQPVNVKKMKVKHKIPGLVRFFRFLLGIALIIGAAYFVYSSFFDKGNDSSALKLEIKAPEKIAAGEVFSYEISYHNPSKFSLTKTRLELQYPDNFIITASSTAPVSGNYGWNLGLIDPGANGQVIVSGYLVAPVDSLSVINASLNYVPANYSSQFKKEASASTVISGIGFEAVLSYGSTAFIGQDNSLSLKISRIEDNRFGDFNISFSLPAETDAAVASSSIPGVTVSKIGGNSWLVSGLTKGTADLEIPLSYRVKAEVADPEIKVRLEKKLEDGQAYAFWEDSFRPELVKSDLNLVLLANGGQGDNAVDFGSTLNYSLNYSNKGKSAFKDVVLLASLSGDFLDLNSLQLSQKGEVKGGTIIWTKNEIPGLAEIKPGQEGVIDFSLRIKGFDESDLDKSAKIVAYAQYGINNQASRGEDNKSNTVNSLINSDTSFSERILYFNDDNLPVGSGPLPPKVGEKSSFRVYWTVKNNLHELKGASAIFSLPAGVEWDGRSYTNVGTLSYDGAKRQIIWQIGRLPVSVYRADAEFSLGLTPAVTDRDKILVLSPGSTLTAIDTETGADIIRQSSAKTTKLEDDDIAGLSNSGRIQ